jgi:hypothetical protein
MTHTSGEFAGRPAPTGSTPVDAVVPGSDLPDAAQPADAGRDPAVRDPATPDATLPDSDLPDATLPDADRLGKAVAALAAGDVEPAERGRVVRRLADSFRARGVRDLFRPRGVVRWMVDVISDLAPHIPIRDLDTLRRHHGGLDDEQLAERLVRNAALATASVGAAGGGVASVEWAAPPTLLSAPVLLAAETVAVVGIELKLLGELHEVYRARLDGSATQRAVGLMQSWADQRGVNPMLPGVGVAAVLSTAARKELRDRLLRRFGRNLTTYGPLLTGAAVASYLNRRATHGMADRVRADLRKRSGVAGKLPSGGQ